MSSGDRVLTIAPDFGGLNNQRIALLGLVVTARELGARVRLPVALADYSPEAGELQRLVPLEEILDKETMVAFLRDEDLFTEAPANEILHLRNAFQRGARYLGRLKPGFAAAEEPACRFFAAAAIAPNLRATADEVVTALGGRQVPALQLRVERDWLRYVAGRKTPSGDEAEEHLPTDPGEILAKVLATEPFRDIERILACCDEADLPTPANELADEMRARFGIELKFKRDVEESVDVPEGLLARAAVDFQVCLTVERYVGLTRSTFSNMACFVKSCAGGEVEHYVYNAPPRDRVVRRIDGGTSTNPVEAVGANASVPRPSPPALVRTEGSEGPEGGAGGRQRLLIEELESERATLHRALREAKRKAAKRQDAVDRLRERATRAEGQLDAARASEAMRVGRAVVAPGHLVKRALSRRARGESKEAPEGAAADGYTPGRKS